MSDYELKYVKYKMKYNDMKSKYKIMKKKYETLENENKKKNEKNKKNENTKKEKKIENKIRECYKKGDKILYKKTNEIVQIEKVHYDDIIPYYTITMKNGREIQTTKEKLKVI